MKVTLITRQGQAAVVQWVEGADARRAIVPLESLRELPLGGEWDCDDPEAGIPYGAPWAQLIEPTAPDRLEAELHRVGIWTARDALEHVPAVEGALRAALGADLQTILATAFELDRASQKED